MLGKRISERKWIQFGKEERKEAGYNKENKQKENNNFAKSLKRGFFNQKQLLKLLKHFTDFLEKKTSLHLYTSKLVHI